MSSCNPVVLVCNTQLSATCKTLMTLQYHCSSLDVISFCNIRQSPASNCKLSSILQCFKLARPGQSQHFTTATFAKPSLPHIMQHFIVLQNLQDLVNPSLAMIASNFARPSESLNYTAALRTCKTQLVFTALPVLQQYPHSLLARSSRFSHSCMYLRMHVSLAYSFPSFCLLTYPLPHMHAHLHPHPIEYDNMIVVTSSAHGPLPTDDNYSCTIHLPAHPR